MDKGDSVTFMHGKEMLKHAMWLIWSWLQGRDYKIVHEGDLEPMLKKVKT
jgi:hypothetical protein